jgi:Cd(II)/Pb(II)-responsive transcriptional regulator
MKIGELAKTTGTQVETVRYYEREGLLPTPQRTDGNYRIYGASHVERLSFIRHCRSLDMTLGEIRILLGFKDTPEDNCEQVNVLLDEHIGHVAQRIQELRALEQQLKNLRAQCHETQQAAGCGILNELSSPSRTHPAHASPAHVHGTHARAGQTAVKPR